MTIYKTYDPRHVRLFFRGVELNQAGFACGAPISLPAENEVDEEPEVALTAQPRGDIEL